MTAHLTGLGGLGDVPSGSQQSSVSAVDITYSANDPSITADGAIEIADGSTPTVDELLELCTELNAKVTAISAVLDAFGLSA